MNVPKTPIEFEYDLWTAKEGKYMVRIKATGEICEVDTETMRFLRAEEKKLRRALYKSSQITTQVIKEPFISLGCFKGDGNTPFPLCLENQYDIEKIVMENILVERFLATLSPKQLGVYQNCIIGGKQYVEYAKEISASYQYIQDCIAAIRKKAKKFFKWPCICG